MEPIQPQKPGEPSDTSMENIPPEIKIQIAQYLDVKSLANLELTSREWKTLLDDEHFFPLKKMKRDFPEIFLRVAQLVKAGTAPKKESIVSRLWKATTSIFNETKVETTNLPFEVAFRARFFDELQRVCEDYDVPRELYTKTVDDEEIIAYKSEDIEKIKSHIRQCQDLGFCQLCRSLFCYTISGVGIQGIEIHLPENVNVTLADDLNNLEERAEEVKQWREHLSTINPSEVELGWRVMNGKSVLSYLPPEIELFAGKNSNKLIFKFMRILKSFPSEIGKLSNLTLIHVDGCQLKSLPPEIGQLENLRQLNITCNTNPLLIPKEILKCKNLKILNFSGTQLTPESQKIIDKLKKQNNIK